MPITAFNSELLSSTSIEQLLLSGGHVFLLTLKCEIVKSPAGSNAQPQLQNGSGLWIILTLKCGLCC